MCAPVYPDSNETLIKQANLYLREKNLPLSQSNINFLIDKCNGQRSSLKNEIDKISIFSNGKKVNFDDLVKLIYLNKNHEISILVDNCLLQNLKKTMNIINDNKFNYEDNILIIRSMLNKAKKILKLSLIYENNNNLR